MGALVIRRATGLQTAHNPFSGVQEGALLTAKNVGIFSNGVLEPRRGHRNLSYTLPTAEVSSSGAFFGDTLVVHHGESISYDTGAAFTRYPEYGSASTTLGNTFRPVDDALLRMQFIEARGEMFFNHAEGIGTLTRPHYRASFPPILRTASDVTVDVPSSSGTAWFSADNQVAYRWTVTWTDSDDGDVHESAPSDRIVLKLPPAFTALAANVSRTSNVVTVSGLSSHNFTIGMRFSATSSDAAFVTANNTVTDVTSSTITYTHAGANGVAASTVTYTPSSCNVEFEDLSAGVALLTSEYNDVHPTGQYGYRIYRTALSGGFDVSPGDEMFLVSEGVPLTSSGTFDNTLDAGLSTIPLYTNARTGDSILQANEPPPKSKCLAYFNERAWYANTEGPQKATLRLLGTGATAGLQAGDTVAITYVNTDTGASSTRTITAVAYSATPPIAGSQFAVVTHSTPTINVQMTCESLVRSVNALFALSTTLLRMFPYAKYVTTDSDPFGNIYLAGAFCDRPAFTVELSRSSAWAQGASATSGVESRANALYYSRPSIPDAVPLLNYLLIGAKNAQIVRTVPLREKLYVFKEDGIYTVAGEEPFRVDLLDAKTRLIAPDSAVVLNNQILCFTNQGVVAVSDAGIQILSRAIEDELKPFQNAAQRANIQRYTFAVAHETDRTYELWLPGPGLSDSRLANTGFVFNVITQTWTTWTAGEKSWGVVSPTDVRYYGGGTVGTVYKERRDYASTDYCDEEFAVTINSFAGTTLTPASMASLEVGDAIRVSKDGSSQTQIITTVGASTITVDTAFLATFTSGGTAECLKAFECDVRWTQQALDKPASMKNFAEMVLHFARPTAFTRGFATFSTETSPATTADLLTSYTQGWGNNAWGAAAWGDPTQNLNMRGTVPLEKQEAGLLIPGFRVREAGAGWRLLGATLSVTESSEWSTK